MKTMQKATVIFLVKDGTVLLAVKKKKVGKGRLNGFGGKPDGDESLRACAVRELFEESGEGIVVREEDLIPRARIKFFNQENNPDIPDMEVYFYVAENFEGTARETNEMGLPEAYPFNEIPFEQMMSADKYFVPNILKGECLTGVVNFTKGFGISSCTFVHENESQLEI